MRTHSKFFNDALSETQIMRVRKMYNCAKASNLSNTCYSFWVKKKFITYRFYQKRDCWVLIVSCNGMSDYYIIDDDDNIIYDFSYKPDNYDSEEFSETNGIETVCSCSQRQYIPKSELRKLLGLTGQINQNIKVSTILTDENIAYIKFFSDYENATFKEILNKIIEEDIRRRYDELKSIADDF